MARPPLILLALFVAAAMTASCFLSCDQAAASDPNPAPSSGPVIIYHDYGTLDLGTRESQDLEIPVPKHGKGDVIVEDSFRGNCSCIIGMVMIHRKDGTKTVAYGLPADQRVVGDGDRVVLRLTLDTRNEEATDVSKLESRGFLGFQLNTGEFARYESVIIRFDYGIRTPIKVSPVAHIDFGELPRSRKYHQVLELSNNIEGQKIVWGAVHASPRSISARLEHDGDKTRLHVTITPHSEPMRHVRGLIAIGTGLDHFTDLQIPVSGTFCGDIQYMPAETLAFDLFDFTKEKVQFVNVVDHDTTRPPGFVLHGIKNSHGNDMSKHFDVSFKPLSGRQTRVIVKYLGTMGGMRMVGELTLAKVQGGKQIARLSISGHNTPK